MKNLIEIEGRYFKECNVVMLPTKDFSYLSKAYLANPSHLRYNKKGFEYDSFKSNDNQHLYITSDDGIKENDWCIIWNTIGTNMLVQYNDGKYYHRFQHNGKGYNTEEEVKGRVNKIIATTDKSLKLKRIEHLGSSETEFYINLPQIPQSFIKKYCELGGIDKVLVEYNNRFTTNQGLGYQQYGIYDVNYIKNNKVYAKLNETGNPFNQDLNIPFDLNFLILEGNKLGLKTDSHNAIIIKEVKEKMYSKIDVIRIANKAVSDYLDNNEIIGRKFLLTDNWIKENL